MPVIRRVGDLTLEPRGQGERVTVRLRLNRQPDATWIDLFQAHAAASAFGVTTARFDGAAARVEAPGKITRAELATALDSFIECANLGLRAFPGRVPEQTARPRLVAARFRPRT